MTKSRAPDQEKSGTDHFEKSPILLPSPLTTVIPRRKREKKGWGALSALSAKMLGGFEVGFFWGVLFNIFLVRGHFGCAKRTHRQDRFYTNVVSAAKRTGPNRDHTKLW